MRADEGARFSRREFVSRSAISAGGPCLLGPSARRWVDSWLRGRCAVLDLGAGCVLRESLHGYCMALDEANTCVSAGEGRWDERYRMVIVAGTGMIDPNTASRLMEVLDAGGTVVLESGGGFLGAPEFAAHRRMLRDSFGVFVGSPVSVWLDADAAPYVSYVWPCEVMVRDFSPVIPALAEDWEVIGRIGAIAVACKKRVGNGDLIFFGSPLGPALRAGDLEAKRWLKSLASTSA